MVSSLLLQNVETKEEKEQSKQERELGRKMTREKAIGIYCQRDLGGNRALKRWEEIQDKRKDRE